MTIAKSITKTLDISVEDVRIDLTATIRSYDLTDTQFIFEIKSSNGMTVNLTGSTAMYIVEYVHNSQTYAIQGDVNITGTDTLSFNLPEDLKGYSGTVLIGIYVKLTDGTKIDIKDIAVRIEPSIMDKDIDFSAKTYFKDFESIKAEVVLEGEKAKTQINQVLPSVQEEGEKVKTQINAVLPTVNSYADTQKQAIDGVVSDVNGYADTQKQAILDIVSDVQSTGDTAKEEIRATLPSLQSQVSELKEDLVDLESVIYVKNIDEMIANSLISSTSNMTFVGNDFTLTGVFGGVFGFETGHHYKMILIPTASSVYATIKILDNHSGTYVATLLSTTYIAKDNAVVIDIPNTITWNNNKRIVFQNANTYIPKGKLYIYDVTEIPENVIKSIDFAKCTNPLRVELLSVSNENAKQIVNYDNWYKGKKLATLGDSITEQGRWQSHVKDKLLFSEVINKGIGGTRISGTLEKSMWQDVRVNSIPLDTDVLTIMGGTNDSATSVSIGDLTIDNYDVNTFVGAYNVLISKLLYKFYNLTNGKYSAIDYNGIIKNNEYKDIKIFIFTPVFNANEQYSGKNSLRLEEIANATMKIAEMWKLPCVDVFHNAGINSENASQCLGDDIHINDLGAKKVSIAIIGEMKKYQSDIN